MIDIREKLTICSMVLLVGCNGADMNNNSNMSSFDPYRDKSVHLNEPVDGDKTNVTDRLGGGGDGDLGGGPSDITKINPNVDIVSRTGGGGDGDLGGGPSDITKINPNIDIVSRTGGGGDGDLGGGPSDITNNDQNNNLGGDQGDGDGGGGPMGDLYAIDDLGPNKIPIDDYNPNGFSCKNGLGSDYWTLMGVGGRTDYQSRVNKIVNLSNDEMECYLTSRIKKRRVMNLTNRVLNELVESRLPISVSSPSVSHLSGKRIFPLFTASFYESCANALNAMEKIGSEIILSPSSESDYINIKKSLKETEDALFKGESQFIDCSYTLRDKPTKKYRVIDLLNTFKNLAKENGIRLNKNQNMKCFEVQSVKKCNELNPSLECSSAIQIPVEGDGFISTHDRYHSWVKKYIFEAVEYSIKSTDCVLGGPSNLGKLGLGDSGTPNGRDVPGHPMFTHHENRSIDIAFFQKNTPNNHLRPVCVYKVDGVDKEHCVEEPHLIDYQRTAVFVTKLLESPRLSFIGVDAKISEGLERSIKKMCKDSNFLAGSKGCSRLDLIRSTKSTDSLLFRHHHHHMHVNFR
jgi:hypothetical protein